MLSAIQLGRFIVRQVAQADGGTVEVDSTHGRAIFTVVVLRGLHKRQGLQQAGAGKRPQGTSPVLTARGYWRPAGLCGPR